MSEKFKKHLQRPIRFIQLWNTGEWVIKIYGISQSGEKVDNSFVSIAKKIAEHEIAKTSVHDAHHYSVFLTIHIAESFNQILFVKGDRI